METVTIKLTKDEIERLKSAINFENVEYYHKKMDKSETECDYVAHDFYHTEWEKNLDLFVKLHEAEKNIA